MARNRPQKPTRVLGLTGPIACGKTTVGDILLELGVGERIDADRVVHALMAAGTPVTRAIAHRFGNVLSPDGEVDRRRLGTLVFADTAALRDLELITHPAVRVEIRARLSAPRAKGATVIIDAVKLLQSDLLSLCDAVWVITCPAELQMTRLQTNRGMSPTDAAARLAAQPSLEGSSVTAIIENSGSLNELRRRVECHWSALSREWAQQANPTDTS
jgi:dephospho-CoA kinase